MNVGSHLMDEQIEMLLRGTSQVISHEELAAKLRLGRPLRVKLGVDPTAPDIHLGHTVGLAKLRQFQDLGHTAVLIIGDFTAMIGDPSGRSATRPQLSHGEVMANAASYREQAFKILDPDKTETVFNGEWFEVMPFERMIQLNSRVTLQQMLQREDFRERLEKQQPIHAHEIQYPIMQGWDSVMVESDIELGGTDQLFNILVGRDLQKAEGQPQQVAMLLPILEGLDGTQKMSKSLGNYVAVNEAPGEMFGKLMSVSDQLMDRYYELLLHEERPPELHPMEAKKELARRITALYHDQNAAAQAKADFELRFSRRNLDDSELPELTLEEETPTLLELVARAFEECFGKPRSNSEIRRLIAQGSVRLGSEKLADPTAAPPLDGGETLRLDKKHAVRIRKS